MSNVSWLSADRHAEWDAFVERHPMGLIYHTSAWQKVLESAFQHIRGKFLVLRDASGEIVAGLPIYTVKSWLLKNRLVSVPFATMCDPLIETREEFEQIWGALDELMGEESSRRIEVRTWRTKADAMPARLSPGAKFKHHNLALTGMTEKALFRSFHDSCVRRRVEKGKKLGVVIESRNDDESLCAVTDILAATRRRHDLPPMPLTFFQAMHRHLSPKMAELRLALHGGKPVGGLLLLKFKDMWISEYSGEYDDSPAGTSQLLYWDGIRLAKESGAGHFSFGRTQIDHTSLIDYKKRWATIEEDLTDYVASPAGTPMPGAEPKTHSRTSRYGKQLLRYAPPLIHRSIGDFCYRHLG